MVDRKEVFPIEISTALDLVSQTANAVYGLYENGEDSLVEPKVEFLDAIHRLITLLGIAAIDNEQRGRLKKRLYDLSLGIEFTKDPLQTLLDLLSLRPGAAIYFVNQQPITCSELSYKIKLAVAKKEELNSLSIDQLWEGLAISPYNITNFFRIRRMVLSRILQVEA